MEPGAKSLSASGRARPAGAVGIDCVVTHHLNPFTSGVVRFNEILAQQLDVPFLGLFDERLTEFHAPLLSFKVSELPPDDRVRFEATLDERDWRHQVYLHDWTGGDLEKRVVRDAIHVWCGNLEVRAAVGDLNPHIDIVWTPGLLLDQRLYPPTEISVFSFGMAHKIRTDLFLRLKHLLDGTGRSYAVYVSSANHETRSIRDAKVVFDEMNEIFPSGLYFLGNLADVAVYNHLQTTTYFAAFFGRGLRDNNTSVAAAMEQGTVVITNLDEHSPAHVRHMENVIDIAQCHALPADPLELKRLSLAAMEAGRVRSWSALTKRMASLRQPDGGS